MFKVLWQYLGVWRKEVSLVDESVLKVLEM